MITKTLLLKFLELRRERVELLGYPDYPTWRLQDRMAKNPANALQLMETVWPAAIARVAEEVSRYASHRRSKWRSDYDRTLGLSLLCRKGTPCKI